VNRFEYAYVGMDIHKETHTAVVLTCVEEQLGSITIDNSIEGFRKLRSYVKRVSKDLKIIYGLEDVTHYGRNLAIFLLEQGYVVKEVNSVLSHSERKNYPSVKKNDTWDSYCIASVLIKRSEVLPDANPQDYYWTMKHLVNRRNSLAK
jgi:Transposase.